MEINVLDIVILIILSVTISFGFWKGLVRQVLTLTGVIVGYIMAIKLYEPFSNIFTGLDSGTAKIISFISIFIICIFLSSVFSWFIGKILKISGLNWLNRIGGASIGFLKGFIVVVIIVAVLVTFLPSDSKLLNTSVTLPYVVNTIKYMDALIPKKIKIECKRKLEMVKKQWLQHQLNRGINKMIDTAGKYKGKEDSKNR